MLRHKLNLSAALVFALVVTDMRPATGFETAPEYRLKAVYVYNFIKFVTWPQSSQSSKRAFVVCVVGDNPFGDELQFVQGKAVKDKVVQVDSRRELVHDPDHSLDLLRDCQMAFISRSERGRLHTILGALHGKPILTVSDIDGFVADNGMIGFSIRAHQVRININLRETRAAGLSVSSKLLEVANVVNGDSPPNGEH